ncbi:MAG: hypothetical protein JWN30_817 [Bacilli bacterium]|nr:hypothetical protein [Bacilli bacterium]
MSISFKLQIFEGPLDLLLHLLDESQVAIEDIPIVEITDQYLAYIHTMQELQLDVASEFLVMATQLLAMKSRKLLPALPPSDQDYLDEGLEEEDSQEALVQKLLEYRKFKAAALMLDEIGRERAKMFGREPEDLRGYRPEAPINPVAGVTLQDLLDRFHRALQRAAYVEPEVHVERDEISMEQRIVQIEDLLRVRGSLYFSELISRFKKRRDLVITFLALLELIKSRKVRCVQYELFADILLEVVGLE